MVKIVLIFLFSFNVYSYFDEFDTGCLPKQHQEIEELLEWWGATVAQIQKAPCKTVKPPSESEMDNLIKIMATGKANETVQGIQFVDESPVLIKAFQDFTKLKKSSANDASSKCDKVLCAMEAIWGRELAKKIIFIKLRHNFNASEFGFNNSDRFTLNEINDVLIGLEDLPEHLIPLGHPNQRLTHFSRGFVLVGKNETNTNVVANSTVMLFDEWSKLKNSERQYGIFHEMSHNVSSRLKSMDTSPEWVNLSGWIKKGDKWSASNKNCIISKYGQEFPWEDFAESLSAYRYNPHTLKKKCPNKYDFLKNQVFKEIEYTDERSCSPMTKESLDLAHNELKNEAIKEIGKLTVTDKDIQDSCKGTFDYYPLHKDELTKCYLKVQNNKFFRNSNPKVVEILKKLGIKNTATNRNQIIRAINKTLMKDEAYISSLSPNVAGFKFSVENILKKSFTAANPVGLGPKGIPVDNYRWRISLKHCGISYFTASENDVIKCQIKEILTEDRPNQKWDAGLFPNYLQPEIFSEKTADSLIEMREEILASHIYKQPVIQEVIKVGRQKFYDEMVNHIRSVNNKIPSLNKWTKMSPEDFCKMTYASGSNWTQYYGIPMNTTIPTFYENCVLEQSKTKKRFEFNDQDLNKLLVLKTP